MVLLSLLTLWGDGQDDVVVVGTDVDGRFLMKRLEPVGRRTIELKGSHISKGSDLSIAR